MAETSITHGTRPTAESNFIAGMKVRCVPKPILHAPLPDWRVAPLLRDAVAAVGAVSVAGTAVPRAKNGGMAPEGARCWGLHRGPKWHWVRGARSHLCLAGKRSC
jgi:hypothetical protein